MTECEPILDGIGQEIQEILYGYIKAESITYSPAEKCSEEYFLQYFRKQPYWQAHPDYAGRYPIPDDPFGRAAAFAMVRGEGPDTVVFVHHCDVVTVEDFKLLKPLAFSPDELEQELLRLRDSLPPPVQSDLDGGGYLFGRGVCDMKGGGSIQMALLNRYSQLVQRDPAALPGTLIVLSVPDEENLSAGMRAAVLLLAEFQEKYGLRYRLMINSEPHQRKDPEKGVFSLGSVGKLMPFVYVRGSLAHVGKVFEGFNPLNLMSEIVRRTELNLDLSDVVGTEAAPPPTWLYLRDRKIKYDVSMPLAVTGCFSILTLNQTPASILRKVRAICEESFDAIVEQMDASCARFLKTTGQPPKTLPWRTNVVDFAALYQEAESKYGQLFRQEYEAEIKRLEQELAQSRITLLECNFSLVDFVYNYIDDLSPRVVFGLIPPYYPNVANLFLNDLDPAVRTLDRTLNEFTKAAFGQEYASEYFYTGISDLSYTSISDSQEIIRSLKRSMPLFGRLYDIPAAAIERISMPCINIGPWGKDFHKLTERVLKQDLYERTPRIIQYALETIFDRRREED